jgi:hypothetical protein
MDMNPICSRTNAISYRNQQQYIPDPPRGTTTKEDLGVPPLPSSVSAPPTSFSLNPYLQRLNAADQDSRNIVRELRGAVVEDNLERTVDSQRRLAVRQFQNRWLASDVTGTINSISADTLLATNAVGSRY